jgi:dimethylargininase
MRIFDFNRAVVRQPGRSVIHGLRSGGRDDPDFDTLVAQHSAYVAALQSAGLQVTVLPPLEDFPDSVFVEDPALVFSCGAILLRPGAASRIDEAWEMEPMLRKAFDTVVSLPDGNADGGDILVTRETVFIGLSARTDKAGAEALAALLGEWGFRSEIVRPPTGTLHLKTGASLVDEETMLVTRAVAESGLFPHFRRLVVPDGEEAGANVLRINAQLLAGRDYPATLDILSGHGAEIVALETSEISKIDAGLTCMSLRWSETRP